ncbi:M28 family metallopeptidase [Sandaracinobacter sp.]|uniref:M28 family metallopeptidase n=1 Tax=Sandaracinobacter sp. TaxID=2487581 RepID=UPI0035AFD075
MRHLLFASALLFASPVLADAAGDRWMSHVKVLADDNMEGRLTGTPGHERAAAYVANEFRKLGLKPAGTDGFLQPVPLMEQSLDLAASRVALDGRALTLGEQMLPGTRVQQLKGPFDAGLVFIGSGLHLPESGHDDFAGMDLKGKIVVVLAGGPKRLSGALKSHARTAEFWPAMQRAGAIGVINVANPNQMDVPWARQKLFAGTPGMRLADPALNDARQPFFSATFSPADAELLFAKSGHSFADMVKLADVGETLPRFDLNQRLSGTIVAGERQFSSPNVVGLLPGKSRALKGEYVVLSAHLDHVGVDKPVNGDSIYNGAMDNASGIASMIESARAVARKNPKRSILLVAVTGEERGLLGSRYFANRPTVPADGIVANINMDMYLPLWPFTHVTALGAEESGLGLVSARVARDMGLLQVPDEAPERNLFVRSDQYSFVRTGVPALALKFAASTPEQQAIQKDWLTNRYHAPSDDLSQPIEPAHAVAFNKYLVNLITTVANLPERPTWNEESFFKRFAPKAATGAAVSGR